MSESTIQKQTDFQGLSTAILLPSVSLFGEPAGLYADEVGPLTSVVGIGLFQRAVLTLQRAGIRQLMVLVGPEEYQLRQALGKGPRVTIPVRWMPIREFPLDDPRTWEALAAEVRGFCLLSGVQAVFASPLIESLRQEVQEGQAIVVARADSGRDRQPRRSSLRVKVREGRLFSIASRQDGATLVVTDLVVLPASFMSVVGQGGVEAGTVPIRRWLERAAVDGHVRVLSTEANRSHWYQDVRDAADVQAAEKKLFNSLKGEFEGFVDRFFNRKVSRWFTRFFLVAGFSPNAITILASLVGLVAATGFGLGTYSAGIIAALLFQLAAIIDCCDGEVARLTFTESPFGAWLDIAMDNVVHMAIFAGIAVGSYLRLTGSDGAAWGPLALGTAAVLGNGLSFWLVTRAQKIKAASGWRTPVQAAWSDFMLKNVASRDFSVIVLTFAVLGKLDWFLWMAAIGSVVFSLLMLWVIRPSATTRA